MSIANLYETILASKMRSTQLQLEITELQSQKNLAVYAQTDAQSMLNNETRGIRDYFKEIYENDPTLQEKYVDYTEIPDYEEEVNRVTALYQDQLEELVAWETALDAQITTNSTELEEIKAFLESYESMLTTNIGDDFDYGLG